MTVRVKICGLMGIDILRSMEHLAVDYIGFVFAKSKRQVDPQQAKAMVEFVKERFQTPPLTVGVFMNPDYGELEQAVKTAGLDVVQLHGEEPPEFCGEIKTRMKVGIFKVFSIGEGHTEEGVRKRLESYRGRIDAVMLDTYDPSVGGGTGKTFRWEYIPHFRDWARQHGLPLIVAGGLNAENVCRLITTYRPDGVDVSSGVETGGVKDIGKITAFVERVKSCENSTG